MITIPQGENTANLTPMEKAEIVSKAMIELECTFRLEERARTARRVYQSRIALMASPDAAARLYDIIKAL